MIVAVVSVIAIVGGVVLTVVLVSNHNADVAAEERRQSAAAQASSASAASAASVASAEASESEREAAELAAAQDAFRSCKQNVGDLYRSLSNIDARLDVGLSQGELSDMLGKASIAYNRVDIDALGDGNCLLAAARMETAFNSYNSTVSSWSDCIYDFYCDVDDIEAGMQTKWSRASRSLEKADRLLEEMDPASPTYVEGSAGSLGA